MIQFYLITLSPRSYSLYSGLTYWFYCFFLNISHLFLLYCHFLCLKSSRLVTCLYLHQNFAHKSFSQRDLLPIINKHFFLQFLSHFSLHFPLQHLSPSTILCSHLFLFISPPVIHIPKELLQSLLMCLYYLAQLNTFLST